MLQVAAAAVLELRLAVQPELLELLLQLVVVEGEQLQLVEAEQLVPLQLDQLVVAEVQLQQCGQAQEGAVAQTWRL